MYLKLFLESFERKLGGSGKGIGYRRSGSVTGLLIILLIIGAGAAYIEHGRGNIQKIKRHLRTPAPMEEGNPRPGGQDPIVISRPQPADATTPQFLSTTLLPGRGMNVLQISAFIPGMGVVNLLDAPALPAAAQAMSGVDDDSEGQASLTDGAAFLVPWAGSLGGITSIDGKSASVTWKDRVMNLPANGIQSSSPSAYGGLLAAIDSNSVQTGSIPDGAAASAVFASPDMDDRWPAKSETSVSVQLTGQAIEMTVDVKNIGEGSMPVGIGWAPRFAIPGGSRAQATLHLPATVRSEHKVSESGMPDGILRPVAGTPYDYTPRNGVALANHVLEDTFTHLVPSDPIELRDPAAKFGIRIRPLSPTIKAIYVATPAGANYVSITPQMNLDDPFGRQWPENENTGIAVVAPGQSVQWKIRLELFALPAH